MQRPDSAVLAAPRFNPAPNPGLRACDFTQVCPNGFGDGNNSYAHSMAVIGDYLYVGTFRCILIGVRRAQKQAQIDLWPVPLLTAYTPEYEAVARGEIWRLHLPTRQWERVQQAPYITDDEGNTFSRELGYRGMTVFQGKSDSAPAIYTSSYSRSKGAGPIILRCEDGKTFKPVGQPGLVGLPVNSLRSMVSFKGRLFTAPTGSIKGNPNYSLVTVLYESHDPVAGDWRPINEPGFGDTNNKTIFEIASFGDHLYAGTLNNEGFQLWRSTVEGEPPYDWELVLSGGAERGKLNQGVASMVVFKDALYIGTAIQGGGIDPIHKIGPAGAEILRFNRDGSWDLLVGDARNGREPASGLSAGFNSLFCGYIWRMAVHDGWLYAGTMDWSSMLQFTRTEGRTGRIARLFETVGLDNMAAYHGGFDLWRTYDGNNWLPVSRRGLGNFYNYGVRTLTSTNYGLFVGTANPFGPSVAKRTDGEWGYVPNPKGGLEVWQGTKAKDG